MQKLKIVIIGAGEFAQIAYEYFTFDSDYEVVAFAVDPEFISTTNTDLPVPLVSTEVLASEFPSTEFSVFVAIPATKLNQNRTLQFKKYQNLGYELATYISSHAFVWRNAKIGRNCFIFENNVIQPFVTIGNNCILWSGNHIGHRSIIGNNVFISSHVVISGYCVIGDYSFLGVNATLNDGVTVGENCIIGAAAHLNKNALANLVYVGAPARVLPGKTSDQIDL
jgi:sugar O-acyltransferase (sialic acid O-acetyltransferase NeuD family)